MFDEHTLKIKNILFFLCEIFHESNIHGLKLFKYLAQPRGLGSLYGPKTNTNLKKLGFLICCQEHWLGLK
jgi:hypothetical protein